MSNRSMIVWVTAFGISLGRLDGAAHAADLTLTTGGKVAIELIFSEAGESHTLAMPQLFGVPVAVAERGCRLEPCELIWSSNPALNSGFACSGIQG